jgi:hypothetical protein
MHGVLHGFIHHASRAGLCSIAPPLEILSAKQHTAIGIEQSGVQLLGGSEFYQLRLGAHAQAGAERMDEGARSR